MMNYIRTHLGVKLLLSYFAVILVGVLVLGLTVPAIVPATFNRHLGNMGMYFNDSENVNEGSMHKQGMGMGKGLGFGASQGGGMMLELFEGFRNGVFEALVWSAAMSVLVAVLIGLFFSRGILRPLKGMMFASQRIADGHYDERVETDNADELGQMAERFNQMAEALHQVESMRRQLIGDVSHELRTPLTAIKGSIEGLMDGILPATDETYQQIHGEAERLARLVDDLQELSRVEAGSYDLDLRPMQIAPVLKTAVNRLRWQVDKKRIDLTLELPTDLPSVLADEHRIIQVLTNLIANALQYTHKGGKVTLSAELVNNFVAINVRDTGEGIVPEHIPHIFDRFYRVDKSRSRGEGGGSGIGLTIAKFLVEAHQGEIKVESEGKGKGSEFTFTLPVE